MKGSEIRVMRKRKNVKQDVLAKRLGLYRQTLHDVESDLLAVQPSFVEQCAREISALAAPGKREEGAGRV